MEFNPACVCCRKNVEIQNQTKQSQRKASAKYYQKHRERVILAILKKYYKRKI